MDAEDLTSEESQPLLDENHGPLLRRRTRTEVGLRYGRHVFHAATKALRESGTGWLLVFMPLGIVCGLFKWNSLATLLFNIAAIIPLSTLVSESSDQLCDHIGELMGGLINATFGNTVELIIGTLAVVRGEISVAQSMMMGSILSDILLVLGICVVASTYAKETIEFNKNATNVLCSLMTITTVVLIIPTVLYSVFASSHSADINSKILTFSRGVAIILFFLYMLYLYFNLGSHSYLFLDKTDNLHSANNSRTNSNIHGQDDDDDDDDNNENNENDETSTLWIAGIMLFVATGAIVLCTYLLLDCLDSVSSSTRITKRFIAAVLLPICSNAPELASIIIKTKDGRPSHAISVIVSSILQIALFVIPFLTVLGWIIHQPMTLSFEVFLTTLLFLAVLAVNRLLKDGVYTYVHGVMLMQLYGVMALTIYIRPEVRGK